MKKILKLFFEYYPVIIFFIVIFGNCTIHAGESPRKKIKSWGIDLSLNTFYDSNILKYSDKYIDRFKNREDAGRFHVNRYDDLVFSYSISFSFTKNFYKKLKTTFGTEMGMDTYSYNNIKSWSSFDIYWQQEVTNSTSFAISYSYIPEFYIRHFYDDDWTIIYGYVPETFQPYKFSKEDYSLWVQQYFWNKKTRLRVYFSYMKYFHNQHYTEFDSKDYLYGFRVYQKLTNFLSVNAGYKYTTSDAKGFDQPGELRLASDDSDGTNYEHIYLAGIELKLPKIFSVRNDLNLTAQYQEQFFTTKHFYELDPLHSGRYDYNYRVFFNYNFDLFKDFTLSAFFTWMNRDTHSTINANEEYISDEKDYSQYQTGIKFNYQIKF